MELPRPAVHPSTVSPHPRAVHESTAASTGNGISELRFPEAEVAPPPPQRLETTERGDSTAQLQQPLIPVPPSDSSPAAQQMPERSNAFAAGPTTDSTLQEQLSSPPRPPPPHVAMPRPMGTGHPNPSTEKLEDTDSFSGMAFPELHRDGAVRTNPPMPMPQPARLVDNGYMPTRRQRTLNHEPGSLRPRSGSRRSNVDWVVPVNEKGKVTVAERLQPTLDIAIVKRDNFASKARSSGWTLNIAIGLQVLFGAITTGLSGVATAGRSTATATTVLGALLTMLASYLAKARGSKEPELSIIRVRDLEHFIREMRAFMLDHGHVITNQWDREIDRFRQELEKIIVHANGGLKSGPSA